MCTYRSPLSNNIGLLVWRRGRTPTAPVIELNRARKTYRILSVCPRRPRKQSNRIVSVRAVWPKLKIDIGACPNYRSVSLSIRAWP